jgi:hypothetical protein
MAPTDDSSSPAPAPAPTPAATAKFPPRSLVPATLGVPSRRHLVLLRRAQAYVKEVEDLVHPLEPKGGEFGRALTGEEESFVRRKLELAGGNVDELWHWLRRDGGRGNPLADNVLAVHVKVHDYKKQLDEKGGWLDPED